MTLVDANLLIYASDADSPFHDAAVEWLTERLNGDRRVAFSWLTLGAFLRFSTHPNHPRRFTAEEAWDRVEAWLEPDVSWIAGPGPGYAAALRRLMTRHHIAGALVTDAQLAALAIEHGLTIYSSDTDFARFTEVRWENPLQPH